MYINFEYHVKCDFVSVYFIPIISWLGLFTRRTMHNCTFLKEISISSLALFTWRPMHGAVGWTPNQQLTCFDYLKNHANVNMGPIISWLVLFIWRTMRSSGPAINTCLWTWAGLKSCKIPHSPFKLKISAPPQLCMTLMNMLHVSCQTWVTIFSPLPPPSSILSHFLGMNWAMNLGKYHQSSLRKWQLDTSPTFFAINNANSWSNQMAKKVRKGRAKIQSSKLL